MKYPALTTSARVTLNQDTLLYTNEMTQHSINSKNEEHQLLKTQKTAEASLCSPISVLRRCGCPSSFQKNGFSEFLPRPLGTYSRARQSYGIQELGYEEGKEGKPPWQPQDRDKSSNQQHYQRGRLKREGVRDHLVYNDYYK